MGQFDVVWVVQQICWADRGKWASVENVADRLGVSVESAGMSLVRAFRNGRLRRIKGENAFGDEIYLYQVTDKGEGWLDMVE